MPSRIIPYLIKWDATVVKTRDSTGFTPLHRACQTTVLALVKAFELQLKDKDVLEVQTHHSRNTPLHIACIFNALEIVKFLIENSANVNASNEKGETPIHISARKGFKKITEELLRREADLDVQDAKKCTPLICAALNNHKSVVSLLLQK